MKKVFGFLILTIALSSFAFVQTESKQEITFDKIEHDFGEIPQGIPVTYIFNFTNTGDVPVKLSKVKPSCGCTSKDYTKDVVMPGEKGYVSVTYNASALGAVTKSVSVNYDDKQVTLRFKAKVVQKDADPGGLPKKESILDPK